METLMPVTAQVISCPGRLGDVQYWALEVDIVGLDSPYVFTLALPAIGARALAGQVEVSELYRALAEAINAKGIKILVEVKTPPATQPVAA